MVDILIVEDNYELKDVIERFLLHAGYQTYCVDNGSDALHYLETNEVRLLLLDIMLPDMDGFHICEHTRQHTNIPIIIMSARNSMDDQLLGYDIGADDYVEKPFPCALLLAKIKALLRREYEMEKSVHTLEDEGLVVNLDSHHVACDNKTISLSMKEFELLVELMKHSGTTLKKEYLFTTIWGTLSESELSTLTVHINTLRDKIEKDAKHPKRIVTVWGVGYRYEKVA